VAATEAAIAARRAHVQHLLDAVRAALRRMDRDGIRVTVRGVALLAGVSRTFLYQNPDARRLLDDATAAYRDHRRTTRQAKYATAQQEASWRERALNAEDQLRRAHGEIRALRARIGDLMGQLDDLTQAHTEDSVQAVASANTQLKQQLRQLSAANRQLEEKLTAARTNNRFLDKRIADLEVQLVNPATR
jgi:chromosome segregation ATPase